MEKLVYLVWKTATQSDNQLREELINEAAPAMLLEGSVRLRIAVVDDDVAAAENYRIENTQPPISALVSVWLDAATCRDGIERVLALHASQISGFLVTESEPLRDTVTPQNDGQRTPGMCQVVLLQKPPRLSYEHWLDIWQNSHTQVAIDTQSTFAYRQNVVVRHLGSGESHFDAIVEENFPEAAMHSRAAFYAATDDQALHKAREQAMIDSVVRFIDFDRMDCIPMSEYVIKH